MADLITSPITPGECWRTKSNDAGPELIGEAAALGDIVVALERMGPAGRRAAVLYLLDLYLGPCPPITPRLLDEIARLRTALEQLRDREMSRGSVEIIEAALRSEEGK